MPYRLYNRRGSGGFAAEAALTLAGQPFELIAIESLPSTPLPEEFRTINPWRQVPALITPDGTLITETAAILIHVATAHPGPDVGPAVASSRFSQLLRWSVFLSVNLYEGTLRGIYSDRYTTAPDGQAGIREAATARNREALALLENELLDLRPYLLGDRISVIDPYFAMLCAWQRPGDDFPAAVALTHRVAAHPVIAPIWQHHFDHRLPVKWGRTPDV